MSNLTDRRAFYRWLRVISVIVLLGFATIGTGLWLGVGDPIAGFEITAETVRDEILSWGAWGMAGSVALMVLHSFVPFPAEIVAMANGMAYGPFVGLVVTWVGAMLGAYLAFGLARWLGRPFVEAMLTQGHLRRLDEWVDQQGGGTLFFSRFIPVISFNLINYAAGLTAISWWTFTWATGVGILPITFVMVWAGHSMWSGGVDEWIWLVVIGVAGWAIWHWMVLRRRGAKGD